MLLPTWSILFLVTILMILHTKAQITLDANGLAFSLLLGFGKGLLLGSNLNQRRPWFLPRRRPYRNRYGLRGRRAVPDIAEEQDIEEKVPLQLTSAEVRSCALRLVCEIAQRNPDDLTDEELVFVASFSGISERNLREDFYEAVVKGVGGEDCDIHYPPCDYRRHDVKQTVLSAVVSDKKISDIKNSDHNI